MPWFALQFAGLFPGLGVAQVLLGQTRGFGLAGCRTGLGKLLRLLLCLVARLLAAVEWCFFHAVSEWCSEYETPR